MSYESTIYDVIIIGSGIFGLITALTISDNKNLKILIVEKNAYIGGKLKNFDHFITNQYKETINLFSRFNNQVYLEECIYQYNINKNFIKIFNNHEIKDEAIKEILNFSEIPRVDKDIYLLLNDIIETTSYEIDIPSFKEYIKNYAIRKFQIRNKENLIQLIVNELKSRNVMFKTKSSVINIFKHKQPTKTKQPFNQEGYKVDLCRVEAKEIKENRIVNNFYTAKYIINNVNSNVKKEKEKEFNLKIVCKFKQRFWPSREKLFFSRFMVNYLNVYKNNVIMMPMSFVYDNINIDDGEFVLCGIIKGVVIKKFMCEAYEKRKQMILEQICKIFKNEITKIMSFHCRSKELEYEEIQEEIYALEDDQIAYEPNALYDNLDEDLYEKEEIKKGLSADGEKLIEILRNVNEYYARGPKLIKKMITKQKIAKGMPFEFIEKTNLEKVQELLIEYAEQQIPTYIKITEDYNGNGTLEDTIKLAINTANAILKKEK